MNSDFEISTDHMQWKLSKPILTRDEVTYEFWFWNISCENVSDLFQRYVTELYQFRFRKVKWLYAVEIMQTYFFQNGIWSYALEATQNYFDGR